MAWRGVEFEKSGVSLQGETRTTWLCCNLILIPTQTHPDLLPGCPLSVLADALSSVLLSVFFFLSLRILRFMDHAVTSQSPEFHDSKSSLKVERLVEI